MKKLYVILLVVILTIGSLGCSKAPKEAETVKEPVAEVLINTYYEKPLSLENKETLLLKGILEGDEYIEIIVKGAIYNFEQISINWDEAKNELVELKTINVIEKIKDQTVVIQTMQPEGIPSEKLKWKDSSGEIFEYIIQENGVG